jgi:hypothetical protein
MLVFSLNQGISQLLIILRVAKGRAVTNDWSSRIAAAPTTVAFSRSVSDWAEESKDQETARSEQGIVHTYPTFEKAVTQMQCKSISMT